MRSAPQPIKLQQFHERKEKIPDELRTILKAIDGRLSRGIRVISTEYKNEIIGIKTGAFEAINDYDFVYTNRTTFLALLRLHNSAQRRCGLPRGVR